MPCYIDDDSVPILVRPDDARFDEVVDYQAAVTAEVGIETRFLRDGDRIRIGWWGSDGWSRRDRRVALGSYAE